MVARMRLNVTYVHFLSYFHYVLITDLHLFIVLPFSTESVL